ncbi:glutamate--tRNA ligase [Thomasclavelia spiroformis]|uniref:glutamate--tRNA ligase n=1 Tax=Thomasclavelia spiroformis TaxID=29348 RepID=UPI000B39D451|nr:glutamate--tRNA ligase [Thomasclavelia spiroformis]OUO71531.1 glutamate--tRNA ligase [Thomasclavelia spiroformis]
MNKIRTRFAPSPTGYMHIGNLRTALYSYLIAKHLDGEFILRIEDTDKEREVSGAIDLIYDVLKDTGLTYDEGPLKPGNVGPYIQSKRLEIYQKYAHKLVDLGYGHYCFCSEDTIKENQNYLYDDPCKNISIEEARKRIANNEKYTIRQTINKTGTTTFNDAVYGTIEYENALLDEGILLKSDGYPTYNFANVIDDHLMNITHVVRGNEYLSSTPKYNLIYQAFNWQIPTYIHVPPVMKDAQNKLSKRNGDASYQDLINKGFLSEAIINYIALLGWSPVGKEEIFSLDDLVKQFTIERISKSPAIFDYEKLKWMNGVYLRNMPVEQFNQLAISYYQNSIKTKIDYLELSKILQPRIQILNEISEAVDFIDLPHPFNQDLFINKKMKTNIENSLEALKIVLPELANLDFSNEDKIKEKFIELAKKHEKKNGQIMYPIRVALTFKAFTPGGAVEIAHILGKDETIKRIKNAIEKLEEIV